MFRILIRFISVYFFMLFSMKLLGKRQIGEMQMSELVAAFFLSELGTYAVTNTKIPLYYGLIPIALMIIIEMIISFLALKNPMMKKIFDFAPSFLIREGEILQKELLKNRMTIDELLSMLRLNGYYDFQKVRFAILEPNGQLSVIPYIMHDSVSCNDLGIKTVESGFSVVVINDGKISKNALDAIGKNENWVKKIFDQSHICSEKDVFLLLSDFLGNWKLVKKEKQ